MQFHRDLPRGLTVRIANEFYNMQTVNIVI